jgi:peptidyl-prolyl cis-trans isomerase SurA
VLDRLIERQVLYARAEKEKTVPSDDEVATFVNQQRQQVTAEDWEKGLKENSLTEEQVRDEARKDLAIRKLQEKVYGKITIRDQEITDFYNTNRAQFVNPRGVYLSDIVVDAADSGGTFRDDAKSDAEATAKIQRLYATLKGGADFADVARASSEDASGTRGGDIGMANEQTLQQYGFPAELISRFFNQMTVGSYTEPIRFADGRWYIFKLTNRQLENKPLTLEDAGVRDQIRQALINQRQQILQAALVSNAMSDVTVANRLAENMLNDPNNLGGNQPVAPGTTASTPAPAATQSATPAASASPAASPAASATTAATPRPAATAAATPAGGASRPAASPQR